MKSTRRDIAAVVKTIVQEFPDEVEAWGGGDVLYEASAVAKILDSIRSATGTGGLWYTLGSLFRK